MTSCFSILVGQDHIIKILQSAAGTSWAGFDSQEMTHAWLFTGPPGSGRSLAAIAFAQALICPNNGCGICSDCKAARTSSHPDVEVIRTEGLSIKVEEIRELVSRTAWAPSMGGWRVIILEDADRLTESAASALLKTIEEPGIRTVWLLCAPTLHDVLPTIRSRCRHLQLRTPTYQEVEKVLVKRYNVSPNLAEFVGRISQGHIGRARYLATNETARSHRKQIIQIPLQLGSLQAPFQAAQILVDLSTQEAHLLSEERDLKETEKLQEVYGKGTTGRGMAMGGAKAVKELEREQKSRSTRMVRDSIDLALQDITTFYRDVMMVQSCNDSSIINTDMREQIESHASSNPAHLIILKMDALIQARANLARNAAPLVTCEALMCRLAMR